MKQVIDLDNWNRKEHFAFFSAFDDPFFGVTTLVDFTNVYRQSKETECFFFPLFPSFLTEVCKRNRCIQITNRKDSVVRYDTIHISPTIGREDGTFGFGFFEYDPDIDLFIQKATQEIERVKNGTGLSFSKNTSRQDVIRYSALPWFAFSEMKHATSFKNGDSVPRISTGKLMQENSKYLLPISVCAHHGLMDGRNVAELIRKLSDNQTAL